MMDEEGLHTVCEEAGCPTSANAGARHRHVHDPRRHVHPARRLLQREDRQAGRIDRASPRAWPSRWRRWGSSTRYHQRRPRRAGGSRRHLFVAIRSTRRLPRGRRSRSHPGLQGRGDAAGTRDRRAAGSAEPQRGDRASPLPDVAPRLEVPRSCRVLRRAREMGEGELVTKSGLMIGLGESKRGAARDLRHLREHGVDVLTVGEYLRPTRDHLPVVRYCTPTSSPASSARPTGWASTRRRGPAGAPSYHAEETLEQVSRALGRCARGLLLGVARGGPAVARWRWRPPRKAAGRAPRPTRAPAAPAAPCASATEVAAARIGRSPIWSVDSGSQRETTADAGTLRHHPNRWRRLRPIPLAVTTRPRPPTAAACTCTGATAPGAGGATADCGILPPPAAGGGSRLPDAASGARPGGPRRPPVRGRRGQRHRLARDRRRARLRP